MLIQHNLVITPILKTLKSAIFILDFSSTLAANSVIFKLCPMRVKISVGVTEKKKSLSSLKGQAQLTL